MFSLKKIKPSGWLCLVILSFLLTVSLNGQTLRGVEWSQSEFAIGVFAFDNFNFNEIHDRAILQEMVDDHISIATFPRVTDLDYNNHCNVWPAFEDELLDQQNIDYALDLANDVGLSYMVTDSVVLIRTRWECTTPSTTFNSTEANAVMSHYMNLSPQLQNTIYAFYIQDEPSPPEINSSHVDYCLDWIEYIKGYTHGEKIGFFNLLPFPYTYNKVTYENYLDSYLNDQNTARRPSIACTDNYLVFYNQNLHYFYNMSILKQYSNDRPCWGHITVYNVTDDYMRFEYNTHLAYGYKGIVIFSYDYISAANRNEVRAINNYVANLVGPMIINSQFIGTYHQSSSFTSRLFTPNPVENIDASEVISINTPIVAHLSNNDAMVGIFQNGVDYYLYVVNRGHVDADPTFQVTVTLGGDYRDRVYTTNNYQSSTPFTYYSVPTHYKDNVTKFTTDNLLPGEGRLYKLSGDAQRGFELPKNQMDVNKQELEYSLNSFPNPFNPSTNINFTLPRSAFVNISVYDQLGREVTQLLSGVRNSGKHTVKFDGSNFSSGIYFIKLETENKILTSKIILTK